MVKLYKMLLTTVGSVLPVSYHPFGKLGKSFRGWCARHIAKEASKNILIEKGAVIQENVILKESACVGVNCSIGPETIIGKSVMMAPECLIYTVNKKFDKDLKRFAGYEEIKPVIIGDYCWLGARVIILPGVHIGEGCVIGAGAVVTKDMPPYHVVAGNPARAVKSLFDE